MTDAIFHDLMECQSTFVYGLGTKIFCHSSLLRFSTIMHLARIVWSNMSVTAEGFVTSLIDSFIFCDLIGQIRRGKTNGNSEIVRIGHCEQVIDNNI